MSLMLRQVMVEIMADGNIALMGTKNSPAWPGAH